MEERFLVLLWHLIPFHFRVIRARQRFSPSKQSSHFVFAGLGKRVFRYLSPWIEFVFLQSPAMSDCVLCKHQDRGGSLFYILGEYQKDKESPFSPVNSLPSKIVLLQSITLYVMIVLAFFYNHVFSLLAHPRYTSHISGFHGFPPTLTP